MAELDHLVYATPDLDASVAEFAELTGVNAVLGGRHVGFGTMNYLVTFNDRTYLEIIGVDPDQPEPAGPRPFGIDELGEPGLVAYAVHPTDGETIDDVRTMFRNHGFDPGDVHAMSRETPDGGLLEWRLSVGGDTGFNSGGALPFLIDWGTSPSPAGALPTVGSLQSLTVSHPDVELRSLLESLELGLDLRSGEPELTAAVASPAGLVTIRRP